MRSLSGAPADRLRRFQPFGSTVALPGAPLPALLDDSLRIDPWGPAVRTDDDLARLQRLVGAEEVLHLQAQELGKVPHVLDVLLPDVVDGDAEDLLVPALLVGRAEHPDRAATDHTARKRGFLDQHH